MNKLLIALFLCVTLMCHSQEKAIQWINTNAIPIEDANPITPPANFGAHVPAAFKNARIFGFGEASHHGKEFFDLKAKFFKYLVEHEGVRLFLMEESYQAEHGINAFISGGEGTAKEALNNFGMAIWYTNEVAALLQWMRDYNHGKPRGEQVRFYGIDNQFGTQISDRLRAYIKKYAISIDEKLLTAADSCSAALLKIGGIKGWDKKMLPRLKQVRDALEANKEKLSAANADEYRDMLRGLGYLEQYTAHIAAPYSQNRDRDMFENTLKVLELEGDAKAFLWAHNEHINKHSYGDYNIASLGRRLKDHFKEEYYAVGFDFGHGSMKGYVYDKGKIVAQTVRTLEAPYKNTFAETLAKAQPDIYFIDMATAISDPAVAEFFGSKKKQLFLGGPGYDPAEPFFFKRRYTDSYDGLIFVKLVSPATW